MKKINLTKGYHAFVDDEMFEELSAFKWHASVKKDGTVYAARRERKTQKMIYMHRQIANASADQIVDHIDRNPLNNCKSNLRLCNKSINAHNQKLRTNVTSKFRGVHKASRNNKWVAQIRVGLERYHLGTFDTPEEAAEAYNKAAKTLVGIHKP